MYKGTFIKVAPSGPEEVPPLPVEVSFDSGNTCTYNDYISILLVRTRRIQSVPPNYRGVPLIGGHYTVYMSFLLARTRLHVPLMEVQDSVKETPSGPGELSS